MTSTSPLRPLALAATALLLAACSANPTAPKTELQPPATSPGSSVSTGATDGATTPSGDANAPITIWTDATRQPGFQAYADAHPDLDIEITVVDGADLLNKIQLANRAGEGWPDLLWGDVVIYQMTTEEYGNLAQPLNDLIPADILEGFGNNNENCTYDGKIYCLRNDVAPSVLYYSVDTFKKHGYEVPKTWPEFFDLAVQMGKDDPNLRVQIEPYGAMQMLQYYEASGCPFARLDGEKQMTVNWNDPSCTRVTEGLDRMIEAGVLKFDQLNERQTAEQGSTGAMAMTLGAVWRADYVFGPAYQWREGDLGVATVPVWDEANPLTGYEGGGSYVMGSHAKNKEAVIDILLYMTTGDFQKTAGTLPGYEKVRQEWMQTHVLANKLYAEPEQVMEVFNESVKRLDPNDKLTSYNPRDSWEAAVTPMLREGKTFSDANAELQKRSVEAAKAAGFEVKES